MATKDYGADTGNSASTFHEVRTWRARYEPEGKPLIPLRMVRAAAAPVSDDAAERQRALRDEAAGARLSWNAREEAAERRPC